MTGRHRSPAPTLDLAVIAIFAAFFFAGVLIGRRDVQ